MGIGYGSLDKHVVQVEIRIECLDFFLITCPKIEKILGQLETILDSGIESLSLPYSCPQYVHDYRIELLVDELFRSARRQLWVDLPQLLAVFSELCQQPSVLRVLVHARIS